MQSIEGYQLKDSLYLSAKSEVYSSIRESDGASVVLKTSCEDGAHQVSQMSFSHEFEIIKTIANKNIIQCYDLLNNRGGYTLVLEDIGGVSLSKFIKENSLDFDKKLDIAVQVVDGLNAIHQAKFIHKDINPANIIYNLKSGQLKIIDFGITTYLPKEKAGINLAYKIEGTLPYMAPEQTGRMNRSIDYRSDFYSLGVTLYELFVGSKPFFEPDFLKLIYHHLALQPPPPAEKDPRIPQPLSDLIMKLMAKEAEDRYQGCWGIKQDLLKIVGEYKENGKVRPFNVGEKDVPFHLHIPEKLYGREKSKQQVLQAFSDTTRGEKKLLIIKGPAGIGKSSLIKEVYKPLTKEEGYFVSAKFEQFQRTRPHLGVIKIFKQLIQNITCSERELIKWRQSLQEMGVEQLSLLAAEIPELNEVLDIGPSKSNPSIKEKQVIFAHALKGFIQSVFHLELPLVIFFDDIQWADYGSMDFIQSILCDKELNKILVIFAYRDNEINLAHSLYSCLNELNEAGVNVSTVETNPLLSNDIEALLNDIFRVKNEHVAALASIILEKTGGNPLFIGEFIKSLNEESMLTFDQANGRWLVNINEISSLNVSDNVAHLITRRFGACSTELRDVLRVASCIGSEFNLQVLMDLIELPIEKLIEAIKSSAKEGFIIPLENTDTKILANVGGVGYENIEWQRYLFRFAHDRIQQTIYEDINAGKRKRIHCEISEYLQIGNKQEQIFEVVSHYNKAQDILSDDENRKLFSLNISAAVEAKQSASYQAYYDYLNMAEPLVDKFNWETDYQQLFDFYLARLEASYLLGYHDQTYTLYKVLESHAKSKLEIIKINRIKMFSLGAQNKKTDAVEVGLQSLALFNIHIHKEPSRMDVMLSYIKLRKSLMFKSVDKLLEMPKTKDDDVIETMEIISWLVSHAYWTSKYLVAILGFKCCELSLKYGNNQYSPLGYSLYAMFSVAVLNKFEIGDQFADLSEKISEKYPSKEVGSLIILFNYFLVKIWHRPIREQTPTIYSAYKLGLEYGNLEHAFISFGAYINCRFYSNVNLELVRDDCDVALAAMKEIRQEWISEVICAIKQVVFQLRKPVENVTILEGEIYKESIQLKNSIKNSNLADVAAVYGLKAYLCCIFLDYEFALDYVTKNGVFIEGQATPIRNISFHFVSALVKLHSIYCGADVNKKVIAKQIKKHKKVLDIIVKNCPEDRVHMRYMVEGEEYRYKNNITKALEYFAKALKAAEAIQYTADQAMIEERMGLLFIDNEDSGVGSTYLLRARYHFSQWGAIHKVDQLNEKYHVLFAKLSKYSRDYNTETITVTKRADLASSISTASGFGDVDFAYAVKSCHVLSEEVRREKLIDKLLTLLVENTAAHRVMLFIKRDKELILEALLDQLEAEKVFLPINLEKYDNVPRTVLWQVAQGKQSILLDDASSDEQFCRDSYISSRKVKSILCTPILRQTEVTGCLYLERRDTAKIFSRSNLFICELLAAQTAISIDNSRLYDDLRRSEAQYKGLFDHVVEGIFRINREGNVLLANKSFVEMIAYSDLEEIRQENFSLLDMPVKSVDREFIRQLMLEGRSVIDYELQVKDKTDRSFYGLISLQFINDDKLDKEEYSCLLKDITHQKNSARLEIEKNRAEAAVEAKATFLASVSHEIRNPLGGIIGITDILSETNLNSMQRNYVKILKSSSGLLLNLLNDLMDYSKIQSGKMRLEKIDFDMGELVSDTLTLYSQMAAEKQLFLFANVSPDVPQVLTGDPTRIRQILVNLLSNAFKFTEAGSIVVNISLSESNQKLVRFAVKDSGIGISKANLKKLFDAYVQENSDTARKYGGTGLGLTICKKLTELMAGEIGVDSIEGQGSTFWFTAELNSGRHDLSDPACSTQSNYLRQGQYTIQLYSFQKDLLESLVEESRANGLNVNGFFLTRDGDIVDSFAMEDDPSKGPTLVVIHTNVAEPELVAYCEPILAKYTHLPDAKVCLLEEVDRQYSKKISSLVADYYFIRPYTCGQFYNLCYHCLT